MIRRDLQIVLIYFQREFNEIYDGILFVFSRLFRHFKQSLSYQMKNIQVAHHTFYSSHDVRIYNKLQNEIIIKNCAEFI